MSAEAKVRLTSLKKRRVPLSSAKAQLKALNNLSLPRFEDHLREAGVAELTSGKVEVLQLNVGKLCNQTCRHCHVDAGPDRTESMSRETFQDCLRFLENSEIPVVDLTGGAPELNPHFRWFVREVRKLGRRVIDRCNLTVIETPSHRDLPEFFRDNEVEVVCSLPHYRKLSTDRQRGDGVYEKSIRAIRRLNQMGYGTPESGLVLTLVTNPVGAFLPPNQASTESEWRRELLRIHDIRFNQLFTITNMPISRYLEWLLATDNLESYMQTLVNHFNPLAASGVMCMNTLSVGWDGVLYDCDFNQMLEMAVQSDQGPMTIAQASEGALEKREIRVARHCFGCTAGAGSSCGGATS